MQSKFGLRFVHNDPANARYRDPLYDEKRLWISRILASILNSDSVIISVDESNFRSRMTRSQSWNFERRMHLRKLKTQIRKN